jgi:hypothetical protein
MTGMQRQWTQEDVGRSTPAECAAAMANGQLAELLGGAPPGPRPQPRKVARPARWLSAGEVRRRRGMTSRQAARRDRELRQYRGGGGSAA